MDTKLTRIKIDIDAVFNEFYTRSRCRGVYDEMIDKIKLKHTIQPFKHTVSDINSIQLTSNEIIDIINAGVLMGINEMIFELRGQNIELVEASKKDAMNKIA